jgi:hypothetical protein
MACRRTIQIQTEIHLNCFLRIQFVPHRKHSVSGLVLSGDMVVLKLLLHISVPVAENYGQCVV